MIMVTIALIVWAVLILIITFYGRFELFGYEAESLPGRFLFATLYPPLIGFICWVLGFIGDFLLSPVFALFQ